MARMTMRAASTALLLLGNWAMADDVRIGDLAPKSSLAVVGVENWAKSEAALRASELWALWNEPEVKAFIAELWKDDDVNSGFLELKRLLDEVGVEQDELTAPAGSVGLALFTKPTPGPAGLMALSQPPQVLAFADFGPGAAKMKEHMESALDRLERKGDIDLDEESHDGMTVWLIRQRPGAGAAAADRMEGDPPEASPLQEFRAAWVGDTVVLCTSKDELHSAMDRLGGDDIDSVADVESYTRSLAQHPEGSDAYAVVLMGDELREGVRAGFLQTLAAVAPVGDDDVRRLVSAMGLSQFMGASLGFRIGGDAGVTEQTIGVLIPEKVGLFRLLDGPAMRFVPPSFIGPDVSSVSQFGVQFDQVFRLADSIAGALPADLKDQAVAAVRSGEAMLGPAIKAMGPEVYMVQSLARPLNVNSPKSVVAIRTSDALSIANLLTGFAPQFGAEIREFQGNPIYEMKEAGMGLGLGSGFIFVGAIDEVENLMRRASTPDAPGLAAEPRFVVARGAVGEDSQFYGFTDFVQSIEWDLWATRNSDKIALKELESFMEVPDEMRKEYAELVPAWTRSLPSVDVFRRHLGDIVFSMKSTPDGFRGRMVQMRPRGR